MWKCKHCNKEFGFSTTSQKGNHSRHCASNPKKLESYEKIKEASDRFHHKKLFDVKCFICERKFSVKEDSRKYPSKEKYFCSRSCANKIGGRAKAKKYHYDEVAHYSTVAWRYHERKCVCCDEKNVVEVHHLNENHDDNRPKNLVPLCPTHHRYVHSKHKSLIENKIAEYVKNKWG
jgi:hypothetical protein